MSIRGSSIPSPSLSRVRQTWPGTAGLTASDSVPNNAFDVVSLSGNTLAVGAYGTSAVYVLGIPFVTGVNPASGPTTGGTAVTISGTGFVGATAVDFGETAASSCAVLRTTRSRLPYPQGLWVR